MEFSVVFQSILIITIMIFIGVVLSKTFPFNEDTRKLFISLIVNVAMPCIILSSIFKVEINKDTFKLMVLVFCLSIVINSIGIALGWSITKVFYKDSNKKRELAILSGLGNTGFIGIPLCATLIGPEGALFAAIFDAGVDFVIWTVGALILQKNSRFDLKTLKSMINVPTIAIVLGLGTAYFNIKPPILMIELTSQLAALATPIAMIYIGVLIMTLKASKVRESGSQIWVPLSVKLIILPLTVLLLIHVYAFNPVINQTILVQSMMPTLTLASILFSKYSADEGMGAITTILSTIISLSTIPLMLYVVNMFFVF
ncbi:AEC family transporter [Niallia oryzisoli]|uniref:AEC family transporter n=1 Tax=Niallia oryzisoli TaxID=1737571 RepID=A0ABZ2CGT6_9BACI